MDMSNNFISDEDKEKYYIDLTKYIPKEISDCIPTQQVLQSQGYQLGTINYYIQDLLNQCFVETADWGLEYWEKEYGITPKPTDTLTNRRNRILARKRGQETTTEAVIKNICNSFVDKTKIIKHNEEYYFELLLESYSGFHNFLEDLIEIIEELKPAHLGVLYELIATTKSNLYIGMVSFDGEIVATYPYTPNDIMSQTNIYIPIANQSNLETIMTYPQDHISKTLYTKLSDNTYKEIQFE